MKKRFPQGANGGFRDRSARTPEEDEIHIQRRMPKSRTRQETSLGRAGEDFTSVPGALTNVGEEDKHIYTDIPVSVVRPTDVQGDAADDMEQGHSHTKIWHAKAPVPWVAQSRDVKELTEEEEATSLAMLTTELAAADIVETYTLICPIPQRGALGKGKEFHVDLTAKRANGEFWNRSQEADRRTLAERKT